ncbi:hypothetical protein KDM87_01845 [Undibacterium sp. FT147W]|uniref:Uncharacterized protein n=1 Tax=Undibacterium rivi TaxID=2828729 RepID=A0ABS5GY03_9BURK|nr:hypothetical protein [Undibacterium rivi]MBR7791325.1 hypothetical protein [Undibacterium rivi]
MVTEELNEYVFASMVMKSAWSIRCRRVDSLEKSGEITEEQARDMPQTVADVREALKVIRHNKKVVFDTLAEIESAPADSQVPDQEAS